MAKRNKHGDKPGKFPAFTLTKEQAYAEHPANRKRIKHDALSCEKRYRSLGSLDKSPAQVQIEQAHNPSRQTGWNTGEQLSPRLRGITKRWSRT